MKKVLIMEDELNIRSFVVINLKRAGYDAIEAGNGQEALDAIAPDPGHWRCHSGYYGAGGHGRL